MPLASEPSRPAPGAASHPTPGIALARGVCLGLSAHGLSPLTEVALPSGLRMDVCALGRDGEIWCVEVKSCRADFVSDAKWQGYLPWCDRFAFAVPEGFPDAILPAEAGLIRADAHGCEILRPPSRHALAAARRKAMTLRLARLAAERLLRASPAGLCGIALAAPDEGPDEGPDASADECPDAGASASAAPE